jgi:hypothetical protein
MKPTDAKTLRHEPAKGQTEERELPNAALDQVSGGLNPQPLPPLEKPRYGVVETINTGLPKG